MPPLTPAEMEMLRGLENSWGDAVADPEATSNLVHEGTLTGMIEMNLKKAANERRQENRREKRRVAPKKKKQTAIARTRRTRRWATLMGNRQQRQGAEASTRPLQKRAYLINELSRGAPKDQELMGLGAPVGFTATQKQLDLRGEMFEAEKARVEALARTLDHPLTAKVVADYPPRLKTLVNRALARWKPPNNLDPGAYVPKKLPYYARAAARNVVDAALLATLREHSANFAAAAVPKGWVRRVFESGETDRELWGEDAIKKVRGAAGRLLTSIGQVSSIWGDGDATKGCDELLRLAGGIEYVENEKTCPRHAFADWSSALFDVPNKRAGSVRFQCNSMWPKVACLLIRAQITDWLKFAAAIDDGNRVDANDLEVAAMAARELGPLMGERFNILSGSLVTPSDGEL